MDLLRKALKIVVLVGLIFVLAVLFAPTLKGPFVIIHFSTALRAYVLAQLVMLGFAIACRVCISRVTQRVNLVALELSDPGSSLSCCIAPLRC